MGFGNPEKVIETLLKYAHSFEAQDTAAQVQYMFATGASLPADLQFDVLAIDMQSLQFQVFCANGAKTGRDVLATLQARINEDYRVLGVRVFIFCFDDARFVTWAKRREQAMRVIDREKRHIKTYTDKIELSNGTSVDSAKYEYGLNTPLPADFTSVMATPTLLKRASAFLCTLLAQHVVRPTMLDDSDPLEFVISGYRLRTLEQSTVRRVFTRSESQLNRSASIPVGEGEGQCIYWVRQYLRLHRRFLMRANDSDAIAIGLMNAHIFLDERGKFNGQLWLDHTAQSKNMRMLDLGKLYMRLRINADLKLRTYHCGEIILLLGMLAGNDLCLGMPQLGPATIYSQLEALLRESRKRDEYIVLLDDTCVDMLIGEQNVVALVAHAYASISKVQSILGQTDFAAVVADMKSGKLWLREEAQQEAFFQTLWRLTNSIADPAWMHGKNAVRTPCYQDVRAHVRRAFYSLFYYRNIASPLNIIAANQNDADGFSLFGHADLSQTILPGEEKFNGLTRIVCTKPRAQPFVEKWRKMRPPPPKRSQAEALLEQRIEAHAKARKPPGECHKVLCELQAQMSHLAHKNPSPSEVALRQLVRSEQELVIEALASDAPNEAWIDLELRRNTPNPTPEFPACPNEHGTNLRKK
jgi:hypothetical protein